MADVGSRERVVLERAGVAVTRLREPGSITNGRPSHRRSRASTGGEVQEFLAAGSRRGDDDGGDGAPEHSAARGSVRSFPSTAATRLRPAEQGQACRKSVLEAALCAGRRALRHRRLGGRSPSGTGAGRKNARGLVGRVIRPRPHPWYPGNGWVRPRWIVSRVSCATRDHLVERPRSGARAESICRDLRPPASSRSAWHETPARL